jgi:hypothetical protein
MRNVNNYVYMSMFCKSKCFDWLVVGMRVYCRNMYTTLNDENVLRSLSVPMFSFSSRRKIRVNETCRVSRLVGLLFPLRTINSSLAPVSSLVLRRPELSKTEHTVLGRRPVFFPTWTTTMTCVFTLYLSVPPIKCRAGIFIRAQSLPNSLSQHHTPIILLGRYVITNAETFVKCTSR